MGGWVVGRGYACISLLILAGFLAYPGWLNRGVANAGQELEASAHGEKTVPQIPLVLRNIARLWPENHRTPSSLVKRLMCPPGTVARHRP